MTIRDECVIPSGSRFGFHVENLIVGSLLCVLAFAVAGWVSPTLGSFPLVPVLSEFWYLYARKASRVDPLNPSIRGLGFA